MIRRVKMEFMIRTRSPEGYQRDDLVIATIPEIERVKAGLQKAFDDGDLVEFYVQDAQDAAADLRTYKTILKTYFGIDIVMTGAGPKDWKPGER